MTDGIVAYLTDAQPGRRWSLIASVLVGLSLCACGSDPSGQPTVTRATPRSPVATTSVLAGPSLTPTLAPPTRDFDGTAKGEGSQVLIRRAPDTSGEPIGACADGARLHVGERTANGLWYDLAWDPSNPPANCYSFTGRERDPRSLAYIAAALVAPLLIPGTPGPPTTPPVLSDGVSLPGSPNPTAAPPRSPTPVPPPYSLSTDGAPSCASTADGQFLIRWIVTDANGQILAGLAMRVSGPNGQTVPAVLRAGATAGSQVGTALVSAPGTYHLVASMPNSDGSFANEESSVVCGLAPQALSPTATGRTLIVPSAVPLTSAALPDTRRVP